MKRRLMTICLAVLSALSLTGCKFLWWGGDDGSEDGFERVVIMYSAGKNDISSSLSADIRTMQYSTLPARKSKDAVLLVSHGYYGPACVIRMYKGKHSAPVMDTLKRYETTDFLTQPEVMRSALTYVKDNFEARSYGMVFSSHATGWLPPLYKGEGSILTFGGPSRRSIGHEEGSVGGTTAVYELSLAEFRDAIPMHMDYILFDACFMAGVEVAYALRDVCDYLGFSPTEVLTDGFDYDHLVEDLLNNAPRAAVEAVCRHYFAIYDAKTGTEHSATICAVDCKGVDALTTAARSLISKYGDAIAALDPDSVQRYHRDSRHCFYDFRDIFAQAGASEEDLARIDAALGSCVLYKDATDYFLTIPIVSCCGLSMYLPAGGGKTLTEYYRSLDWNKAVGLVN